jgi:hypothetical protein
MKIIFFIFQKLFLTSAHQNDSRTPKKQSISNKTNSKKKSQNTISTTKTNNSLVNE